MARSHADIVEEIVVHLRPWKRGEADIRAEVEKRITLLVHHNPFPRVVEVRQQAANARRALNQLRGALTREPLRSFLVAYSPADAECTVAEADIIEHMNDPEIVEILERKKSVKFPHLDRLDETLADIALIKGPDPRSKPVQRLCTETADALIHELSTKPATGSPDSPLHAIASLLYETITGQPDQNLKRAVDAMIRSWRGLDDRPGRGRPARKRPVKG